MPSKQAQTLAGMPNEVLHAICQCLYPEDIKILRLVDKRMCDLSSEYLMKKAYYALRPKAHAVFQEICDHPVFSRSVVELVYDASMFTKKHAHDPRPESDEKHRGCLRLTEASREIAAMEYAKLLESQDYLISSGHSEQALLRGFRKLKNLKSIFYTDWQNIMLQSWHLKEPTLTDWYPRNGPLRWDVTSACFPKGLCDIAGPGSYDLPRWSTHPLYRAFLNSTASVRNFKAGGSLGHDMIDFVSMPIKGLMCALPSPWILDGCVPPDKYWDREHSRYASCFHSFDIAFEATTSEILSSDSISTVALLVHLLHRMSELRRLKLETWIEYDDVSRDEMLELDAKSFFISEIHWPKLETLDLSGCWVVDSDDLLRFLRRHGQTLVHLKLTNIILRLGSTKSWIKIFKTVSKILPMLQTCNISKLSESDQPKDHLLHLVDLDDPIPKPTDCPFRRRQLDALEQLALGRCVCDDGSTDMKEMVLWLKQSWHDWSAMDRGPRIRPIYLPRN